MTPGPGIEPGTHWWEASALPHPCCHKHQGNSTSGRGARASYQTIYPFCELTFRYLSSPTGSELIFLKSVFFRFDKGLKNMTMNWHKPSMVVVLRQESVFRIVAAALFSSRGSPRITNTRKTCSSLTSGSLAYFNLACCVFIFRSFT